MSPKEVAQSLGMESPPVATTRAGAWNSFDSVMTVNPSECFTSRILVLRKISTFAARHSSSRSVTIFVRAAIAEKLAQSFLVKGDSMFFYESDEVIGCVSGERGFCEMWIRGDEILGVQ